MSKRLIYPTVAEVVAIHAIMIRRYGGAEGIRDAGLLEAALYRPQTGYYKDIIEEAAALMESFAINHCFIDGNKRVAFAVGDIFLRINGYRIDSTSPEIHKKMISLFDAKSFSLIELDKWLRGVVVRAKKK